MRITYILPLLLLAATFSISSPAQDTTYRIPFKKEVWSQDYEPFRIAGNLYYIGTYDLGCYLITTPKGHILINTGLDESVPMLRKHIEALGFKYSDIRILLTNHVHYDHVAGMAAIKKYTGAQMMVNEHDAPVLADGGRSDYLFGAKGPTFAPVKPDRLLHNRDTIKLGGMEIIALRHPGHTKGSCSYLFTVKDEQHPYRVLIANMPSVIIETSFEDVHTYPGMAKDYAYTFKELKKQQFDIWLAAHTSQFDLHKKRKPGDAYNPKAFIDQVGYNATVNDLEKEYLKKLNKK